MPKVMRKIRAEFAKYGAECKYIYRLEIGKKGGFHCHLLISELITDVPMATTLKIVNKYWPYGRVHDTAIDNEGGFDGLANYLCKEPDASGEAGKKASKIMYPYVPSRNLEKPEKEVKVYRRRTMRGIFNELEKRRKDENINKPDNYGYILQNDTVSIGKNPFNGMSFLKYTELRI